MNFFYYTESSIAYRLRVSLGMISFFICLSSAPLLAVEGGYKLTLEKIPDIATGTAAILQGEADLKGDRFVVEHLSMMQPVSVILMAADPLMPLNLNLSKYRFDQSDRSGETDDTGVVSFDFRTQGELKIKVTPVESLGDKTVDEKPAYFLIAWAGDELKPDLAPPVVMAVANDKWDWPIWQIAFGLAALSVIAFLFLKRRRVV